MGWGGCERFRDWDWGRGVKEEEEEKEEELEDGAVDNAEAGGWTIEDGVRWEVGEDTVI